MRHPCRLPLAIAACLATSAATAAAPPAGPKPGPVLHLSDGGFVAGALEDSDGPKALRWRSPAFAGPLEFPLDLVASVNFPPPATLPKPGGDYCFELAGGDVLFGSLVGLDDKAATIETPRLGRLRVDRASLHRISRWRDSTDLIYLGPNGLSGWRELPSKTGWRDDGGQLATDVAGATAWADVGLPARAAVEFEVSWTKKPDFVLALGVQDSGPSIKGAFRFEVWGNDLVAHREAEREADVAPIREVGDGPGRIQVQAYLDQERGRLLVFTPGGKRLADLQVASEKPTALPGIRVVNNKGDVRLEWLRVGRWDGEAPRDVQAEKARIHRADGSIVYGQVVKYEPASKEFVVREEGEGESRLGVDAVASVFLSPATDEPARAIRASYQDGARLSGELIKVDGGTLLATTPGIEGALRLPLAGLRSLSSPRQAAAEKAGSTPRIEMEGVSLRGKLVEGREAGDSSCLAWQPAGADSASPLRHGVSGRVVFKDPPPPPVKLPPQRVRRVVVQPAQPAGLGAKIFNALAGNNNGQPTTPSPSSPPATGGRLAIHLRTGDVIPSEITRIDEQGVSFKSPLSTSTFVAHDKVKAVELAHDESASVRLNKTKRERLLTLPRMQKGSPPTQLIRSRSGDYLRGRVVAMDDKRLQVEVHLETKEVPRDRVGRIIWFHADELDPAKAAAGATEPAGATRVQALRRDGIRLTFLADRTAADAISGQSDVLGACRVPLGEVDQILFGAAIEQAAAQVAYGPWRLHNAPEPKIDTESGAGPGASGTESAMVGKPAPDFELATLDGKKFHLAESKGKVVLLDFWATWCGPCLQAMPQVEAVAKEFEAQGVQLVAVNLQEEPKQIAAMLERHKMHPAVALDRDGVVAEKYAANAIPQTVIIDRSGKVARLFVGGGPHLGDQLREALKAVLAEGKAD